MNQTEVPGRAPAEQLETNRLVLRRYRVAHAAMVSEAIEESRAALEAWAPNVAKRNSVAEVAIGLAALEVAWATSRKLVYGLYDRQHLGFVGEAGLYRIDWQAGVAEIGLWLRTSAVGHHYGRQAYAAIVALAFDELGLQAVEAFIHPPNERSRRLAERAGFHLDHRMPGSLELHGSTSEILVYRREA